MNVNSVEKSRVKQHQQQRTTHNGSEKATVEWDVRREKRNKLRGLDDDGGAMGWCEGEKMEK